MHPIVLPALSIACNAAFALIVAYDCKPAG
jgi:hypothetical protein